MSTEQESVAKRFTNSLAFRLLAITAVWNLLALLVTGIILSAAVRRGTERDFRELLQAHAYNLMGTIDVNENGELVGTPDLGDPRFQAPLTGWIWAVTKSEDPESALLSSPNLGENAVLPPAPENAPDFDDLYRRTYQMTDPEGEDTLRLEAQLFIGDGNALYQVMVAGNLDEMEEAIAEFQSTLVRYFIIFGIGTTFATFFVIRFGLRPLRHAARALGKVREGEADQIVGDYPTEIAPLVREINALLSSNRAIIERARTQVGNLAHALKTPLAIILNENRDSEDHAGKVTREQAGLMQNQIRTYLSRAQIAAQAGTISVRTQIAPVVDRIVRVMSRLSEDTDFSAEVPEKLNFAGEAQDLEEVLGNLFENASRYASGIVELSVTTRHAGLSTGQFALIVDDNGPGVSEDQRARILKRGERLDERVSGSGLGLSIVSDIAREYGGSVELDTSPLGGLRVVVILPLAANRPKLNS